MYKSEMFRDEKFVTINDIRISKNGFKNLSFETSRYADGLESIRGFGTNLNERNLSIIDTISIDFLIDYTELEEFALVYSMFKAIGALPITNDYILDKIKGTLAYERAVALTGDTKNAKKITHLIVLLERMEIVSLERTDSGFSINMILTLYRHGYSSSEFSVFKKKFEKWNEETGFRDKCESSIKKYLSDFKTNGNLKLNIFNVEKLNASFKASALLNEGNKNTYFSEDDKGKKEEEYKLRYETLREFEDMKPTVIEIPSVNIGQLELITHNNIANLPLYGEPIGIKSYMGIGKSSFIVKMIFDENDKAILSKLKEFSDLNMVNHKINIEIPIVNIFDFHTASLTNIFFNNLEDANGVMVTIKFEINGYDYYKDDANNDSLNLNTTLNLDNNIINAPAKITLYYLENVLREMNKNKKTNLEEKLNKLYSSVIATYVSKSVGDGAVSGPTDQDSLNVDKSTIHDYLSIFSSGITGYFKPLSMVKHRDPKLKEGELYKFYKVDMSSDEFFKYKDKTEEDKKIKAFKNMMVSDRHLYTDVKFEHNSSKSERDLSSFSNEETEFGFREISGTKMYKFLDSLGILSVYGSDTLKKNFTKIFSDGNQIVQPVTADSYITNDTDSGFRLLFNREVIETFINTIFSEKINNIDGMIFNKMLYISLIYDIPGILNTNMAAIIKEINDEDYITSSEDIFFDKIKSSLEKLLLVAKKQISERINHHKFIKEVIRLTSIELAGRFHNSPEDYTVNKIETIFEEHIEKFVNELNLKLENDFNKVLDQVNLIAISKTIFGFGNILASRRNYECNVDINNIIKVNIISSALMGIFLFRTKDRTDQLGQLMNNMTNNIGAKLGEYYFIMKKYNTKISGSTEEITDYDFFKQYHDEYINSHAQKDARVGFWNITKFDNVNTLKKDHLFFYGNKIKNLDVEEILWSFETMKSKEQSFSFLNNFLSEIKKDFSLGNKYHKQLDYDLRYKPNRGAVLPSYFKSLFHFGNKINPIMRKRILGNDDPFMNLKKITDLVSYLNKDIIPDYDITVYNADYSGNGIGLFSDLEFKSSFALNNVSSVRVSKDPKTKIKTAKITIIDLDKKLINKDKSNNSISFKANINGDIEFYTVETGDYIKIDLGYGSKKNNEFRGEISSIFNAGNYIEITCVGLGATLYSSAIKELKFGKSYRGLGLSLVHSLFKESSRTSDRINKDVYNSLFSERNCNNHIFNSINENKNEFLSPGQESSMYNVAVMALSTLGQSIKNKFSFSNVNSSSAFYKKIIEDTTKTFGDIGETNPYSTMSNVDFFKNLFNVDKDYEAYGFLQKVDKKVADSGGTDLENTQNYEVVTIDEEKSSQMNNTEFEKDSAILDPNKIASDFIWPCNSTRITSKFGKARKIERYVDGEKKTTESVHKGLDIGPIRKGDIIYDDDNKIWASSDGTVMASYFSQSYGNCVIILHKNDIKTVYAHLKKINSDIVVGRKVTKGRELGIMGNTTRTVVNMATHLHFEVRINEVHVDPVKFLQGEKEKVSNQSYLAKEINGNDKLYYKGEF